MKKNLRVAALTAAVIAGPMFSEEKPPKTVQTQSGPQSGSPGSETPNDSAAPPNPRANSSYQQDQDGTMGLDLGWVGLLGLAGLFGLRRGPQGTPRTEDARLSTSRG